jgi:translocation protein SEC62
MATPRQPSPEQLAAMQQLQQQMATEAAKRGMSPEDFAKQQREQLTADAAKQGMTPEQYVAQLRMRAMAANQQRQGSPVQGQPAGPQQQQPQQQQHQVPVNAGGPPDPKAIAVAQFLRSQDLKSRTCILDGQRKDMFKGTCTPDPPSYNIQAGN